MAYKRSTFPENIDVLAEIVDLPPSQKVNALRFQELKLKSSLTAEEQIELNSLTTLLQNYLITPETFNKFADICIGLEVFFTSEVQDYVVSKQGEMDDYVDGAEADLTDYIDTKTALFDAKLNRFTFLDEYNSITQYRVWNTLSYQGESYLCILDSLGNLPTNTTYFKKIAQKGAQGEDGQQGLSGVGLVFRNSYSATETYNTDECVEYNGSLYACKQDGVSGFIPTNTTYWSLAIAKGASILVTTLRNTVTVSTNVSNVQFLSGGITAFNKNTDSLFVYVNSTYLEVTQDYTINANGISIDKVSGSWDGTENSIVFNFVVIKNIVESITFNDGALIDEGSILKSALVQSVQDSIDSIGDVDDLETTDKTNLVNAVNETSNKINVLLEDVGAVSGLNTTSKEVVGAINEVNTSLAEHKADEVHQEEVHGLRLQEGKLEYFDGQEWQRVRGDGYLVGNISNFNAKSGDKQITLSWQDPDDVTITDSNDNVITIARWKGTKILRKTGSYPQNENDGVFVVDNGIKNQYSENGFTDVGLQNDVEYFYMAFPYTEEDVYTVDESNRISATPTEIKIYGIKIDTTNNNPATALTYIDDAVGLTPASGNNGIFSYGSWQDKFPFNQVKPCLFKNGAVNYYLNPNDYTKKEDGVTASDITSGNDGDVMDEFPKLYWKFEKVGTDLYIRYSDTKADSGYRCLAHTKSGTEKDKVYISVYLGSDVSGKLRSLSGKTPYVGGTAPAGTIGTCRTMAQANGSGYVQMPYYQLLMLQVLGTVMFKNRDWQTALGRGYVDGNSAAISTGGTNAKGMFYGETTGKQQLKFCGIEDFWGNIRYWIDGLFSDANRNILIGNESFNDTGSGYTNYGQGATTNIGGYIGDIQGGTETGFIVKAANGSESMHYPDYGALRTSCLPGFGGGWSSGSAAGAFRLGVADSASSSYAGIGARLVYF